MEPVPTSSELTPTPGLNQEERELVDRVLSMYREGWFPMYDSEKDQVEWVQGRERTLIPLDERFQVSRSLRTQVRRGTFAITSDVCFERVIRECGRPRPDRQETWLNETIVNLFLLLHRAGVAHSVEAWVTGPEPESQPVLVGGVYGLAMGRVFAGESMFSRPELGGSNASKVCLVHLVNHLKARGFVCLDAQLSNDHLTQFGAYQIPAREYVRIVRSETKNNVQLDWFPFG